METLDFKKDYLLENDVVLLRPLRHSDYEALLNYSLNEPKTWKYNAGGPNSAGQLKIYMDHAIQQRQKENEYPFVVFDKRSNTYAGCTRFYDIRSDRHTLQLGFTWYGKKYHGTGLNKNCKYLLLEFAFERLVMLRVGFAANTENMQSISAMKSIGCVEEGVWRSTGFDGDGKRINSILLSILKEEWDAGGKERLKNKII